MSRDQIVKNKDLPPVFATSKPLRGGRRYLPFPFTGHGAFMAASALNSEQAIQLNIQIQEDL
jgi:hypothetical protein